MRTARLFATAVLATSLLAACATRPAIPPSAAEGETLRLEEDLVGNFVGEGEFIPIFGDRRGVRADLRGTWDDSSQTLTLEEDFFYDDGETDRKTWRLTRVGEGEWTGTREDVVGTARGYTDGAAFRLEYNVELGGRTVGFRDVLVEQDDGTILNEAIVGYFGARAGRVELLIRPVD